MSAGGVGVGGFARLLIDWQRLHGRSGLPWQATRDPYRVWLSEVMLQQTQVSTVLDYFPRFLSRFPTVHALAEGSSDEVMALWSGLGYYSRARNLHRCAQIVVSEHGGEFPNSALALQTLPGIGVSTAAAIAAFCFGECISILDGNVKRVLTRVMAYEGDVSLAASQKELWHLAQSMLPHAPSIDDMGAYTQGLMDLGATLCMRSKPACDRCPMQPICHGHASGEPTRFPIKSRRLKRRHESWWLAVFLGQDGEGHSTVWLERRPAKGIWAGLHCTPVLTDEDAALALLGAENATPQFLEPVAHSLTHRELRLHPVVMRSVAPMVWAAACTERPGGVGQWVRLDDLAAWGLPAPLRPLLARVAASA
ncbi:A/G-specific adenine glycosylase [Hydrogenophaga crassostreae]|uniref:Adenine DNA glycosylase n=1 Tax=Hydrogenophaga crassostreae TaxID=1763535 RepID=A0A162W1A2_9BURK|nr:A/G-specific adenine glycosylase [Hydrogenophaga crassostreae]AOW14548.1 A/G-specific adenine glycosylase [Hydrogenophaga crassostreae]OAD43042.1 A/G-specific adenine glycosylase [Hydrogenophaga crassostreae]